MDLFSRVRLKYLFSFLILTSFLSCKEENKETAKVSFYHWKINADLEAKEKEALKIAQTDKVFLHYFDVVKDNGDYERPEAVIRKVDDVLKEKEIIPVVFIKNSIFKATNFNEIYLVIRTLDLINEIHQHHFNKNPKEIQIDCDWTATTKDNYFKFLRALKEKIKVSVTIRLHQIKYKKETGIPPVDYGNLMLYNVGDLKNEKQNSILDYKIVSQYISKTTEYPLSLDVGLPIFSQVVITNNEGTLRLINQSDFDPIKNDTAHFQKVTETLYKVKKKILYKGQYVYKGFTLKLEDSKIDEIVKSYKILTKSNLKINEIVLYHLDEAILSQFKLQELLEELK